MDNFVAVNIGQIGNDAFPGYGDWEDRKDGCAAERDMANDGFAAGGVLEYSPFDEETDMASGQMESYVEPGCMGIGAEGCDVVAENQMLYQKQLPDSDSFYAGIVEPAEINRSDGAVEYASVDCRTCAGKYDEPAPEAMEEGTEYDEPTPEAMGEEQGYGELDSEAMEEEAAYGESVSETMEEEPGYDEPTPESVEERLECDELAQKFPKEQTEQEKKEAEEEDARKRAEHEAAEVKRKAEWEATQQAKKDAREAQLARIRAMGDEELTAEAMKRIGADTEKLTRRNMKDCVSEYVQTLCLEDPDFARLAMHPCKTMVRCFHYINRKAREFVEQEMKDNDIKPENGVYGSDVPDGLCYQWAEDYFRAPDAEEDRETEAEFVPKPYIGAGHSTSSSKKAAGKKAASKKADGKKAGSRNRKSGKEETSRKVPDNRPSGKELGEAAGDGQISFMDQLSFADYTVPEVKAG